MKASNEATARAINAGPWDPPDGMVKQRCPECRYLFAAPPGVEGQICPECEHRRATGRPFMPRVSAVQ